MAGIRALPGLHARYETGTHSVAIYLNEARVYEWPVARNELPDGEATSQYRIDQFAASKLRELFDMAYRLEE